MHRTLFVCTGNICRSPTAEAIFRHRIREAGLDDILEVDSCGTHGYHVGESPDPRTIQAAKGRGYQMVDLIARQLQTEDFHQFDLILALDKGHLSHIEAYAPADRRANCALFLEYVGVNHHSQVPDPYYGGEDGFQLVLDLVEEGTERLLTQLQPT